MFMEGQVQFATSALKERLEGLLDGADVGNGTPAADAVFSALEVDCRIAGSDLRPLIDCSDADLVNLAFDVVTTITEPRSRLELPHGTLIETQELGQIRIGGESWILDAGRPGLHPIETMRSDAHGPNLELLRRLVERLTRRLACRRLGLPHAKHVSDGDDRQYLHFPPCAEAGEVVLQRWANGTDAPRFCAALPEQIEAFAAEIVADMRAFWKRRKDIARQAAEVRTLAERRISGHDAAIEAVILELRGQADDADLDFYVHYQGLDSAMRSGTILDFFPARMRAFAHNFGAPAGVSDRFEERESLRRDGADGWISETAGAILSSALVDRTAILGDLSKSYDTSFVIPGSRTPTYVTLYWDDGMIQAEISMHGKMDWFRDRLELMGTEMPETMRTAMRGRPISAFADLPFGGDLIVEQVADLGGGFRLHIQQRRLLINLTSGRIWERPEAPA